MSSTPTGSYCLLQQCRPVDARMCKKVPYRWNSIDTNWMRMIIAKNTRNATLRGSKCLSSVPPCVGMRMYSVSYNIQNGHTDIQLQHTIIQRPTGLIFRRVESKTHHIGLSLILLSKPKMWRVCSKTFIRCFVISLSSDKILALLCIIISLSSSKVPTL